MMLITYAVFLCLLFYCRLINGQEIAPEGSYYALLDVNVDSEISDIKRNYRKLALQYHPDKAAHSDTPETDGEIFLHMSNAYQVLTDKVLRVRYDYLLSIGVLEYDTRRDWTEFDFKHGLFGENPKSFKEFKDAQANFDSALLDEDSKLMLALVLSFSLAGMIAAIPFIRQYQIQKEEKRVEEAAKESLRQKQKARSEEIAMEALKEAEERKERAEKQKILREIQKQLEEEEEDDDDEEDSDDNNNSDDKKEQVKRRIKKEGAFSCELCRKSFKSEQQYNVHMSSNAHKKNMKKHGKTITTCNNDTASTVIQDDIMDSKGGSKNAQKKREKKLKQQQLLQNLQHEIAEDVNQKIVTSSVKYDNAKQAKLERRKKRKEKAQDIEEE